MRVITYSMKLDEDRKNVLVKENCNYCSEVDCLNSPQKIACMMNVMYDADNLPEEHMWLLALNMKCRLIGVFDVAHGFVNGCYVTPREIFTRACVCGAGRIVVVHNHPSGDQTPSKEDDRLTKRIVETGKMLGIELIDHIVIGKNVFYSYAGNDRFIECIGE